MDIGVYQFKPQFREYLTKFLPFLKNVEPNWITLCLIPLGLLTAWTYSLAGENHWLYPLGALLLALRVVLSTLDGMTAEYYGKTSPTGTLLNRLCPEFADISLMMGLIMGSGENFDISIWACAIAWATSYLGLAGLAVGKSIVSLGPVGQTDRVLALIIACALSIFMGSLAIELFFWWCIFGGLVTCGFRLQRIIQDPS
jgi:phosphatidylglycerophosphate synthase